MTDHVPLDHLTSDLYDALRAELDALRQVARGYCPACGRGDAAPTVRDWERERQRAEQAEAAITRVRDLRDRWVKAGPPPLGQSINRWWDRRLADLNATINEPGETL